MKKPTAALVLSTALFAAACGSEVSNSSTSTSSAELADTETTLASEPPGSTVPELTERGSFGSSTSIAEVPTSPPATDAARDSSTTVNVIGCDSLASVVGGLGGTIDIECGFVTSDAGPSRAAMLATGNDSTLEEATGQCLTSGTDGPRPTGTVETAAFDGRSLVYSDNVGSDFAVCTISVAWNGAGSNSDEAVARQIAAAFLTDSYSMAAESQVSEGVPFPAPSGRPDLRWPDTGYKYIDLTADDAVAYCAQLEQAGLIRPLPPELAEWAVRDADDPPLVCLTSLNGWLLFVSAEPVAIAYAMRP